MGASRKRVSSVLLLNAAILAIYVNNAYGALSTSPHSLDICQLAVCEKSTVAYGSYIREFCKSNHYRISNRCCLDGRSTIVGLDLSSCKLASLNILQQNISSESGVWNKTQLEVLSLESNDVVDSNTEYFTGMNKLNYLSLPADNQCPGGHAAWDLTIADKSKTICEKQLDICELHNVQCSGKSKCIMHSPGVTRCVSDDVSYDSRVMQQVPVRNKILEQDICQLSGCKRSALAYGSYIREFCKANHYSMNNRCCLDEARTIAGLDLSSCNLGALDLLQENLSSESGGWNRSHLAVLSLEDNDFDDSDPKHFTGMNNLNYLSLPADNQCPGGQAAWDLTIADKSKTICEKQLDICRLENVQCPKNSKCTIHSPGVTKCLSDDDASHGNEVMQQDICKPSHCEPSALAYGSYLRYFCAANHYSISNRCCLDATDTIVGIDLSGCNLANHDALRQKISSNSGKWNKSKLAVLSLENSDAKDPNTEVFTEFSSLNYLSLSAGNQCPGGNSDWDFTITDETKTICEKQGKICQQQQDECPNNSHCVVQSPGVTKCLSNDVPEQNKGTQQDICKPSSCETTTLAYGSYVKYFCEANHYSISNRCCLDATNTIVGLDLSGCNLATHDVQQKLSSDSGRWVKSHLAVLSLEGTDIQYSNSAFFTELSNLSYLYLPPDNQCPVTPSDWDLTITDETKTICEKPGNICQQQHDECPTNSHCVVQSPGVAKCVSNDVFEQNKGTEEDICKPSYCETTTLAYVSYVRYFCEANHYTISNRCCMDDTGTIVGLDLSGCNLTTLDVLQQTFSSESGVWDRNKLAALSLWKTAVEDPSPKFFMAMRHLSYLSLPADHQCPYGHVWDLTITDKSKSICEKLDTCHLQNVQCPKGFHCIVHSPGVAECVPDSQSSDTHTPSVQDICQRSGCGSSTLAYGSYIRNFCDANHFNIFHRCCLDGDGTIVGLDLSSCNLAALDVLQQKLKSESGVWDRSHLEVLSLENNAVKEISLTEFFVGMSNLNYLSLPNDCQCPGGQAAWNLTIIDRSKLICEKQVDFCHVHNVQCPKNSHCVMNGPGVDPCVSDNPSNDMEQDICGLPGCESSALGYGSYIREFCSDNNFIIRGRCCLNENQTIIGLDLSGCSLTNIDVLQQELVSESGTWNRSQLDVLSLEDNAVADLNTDYFTGMINLNYVSMPAEHQCPGGLAAWGFAITDQSRTICEKQVDICEDAECPRNSHCIMHSPGMNECICNDGYSGYKCMQQGTFAIIAFIVGLTVVAVILAIVSYVILRRSTPPGGYHKLSTQMMDWSL